MGWCHEVTGFVRVIRRSSCLRANPIRFLEGCTNSSLGPHEAGDRELCRVAPPAIIDSLNCAVPACSPIAPRTCPAPFPRPVAVTSSAACAMRQRPTPPTSAGCAGAKLKPGQSGPLVKCPAIPGISPVVPESRPLLAEQFDILLDPHGPGIYGRYQAPDLLVESSHRQPTTGAANPASSRIVRDFSPPSLPKWLTSTSWRRDQVSHPKAFDTLTRHHARGASPMEAPPCTREIRRKRVQSPYRLVAPPQTTCSIRCPMRSSSVFPSSSTFFLMNSRCCFAVSTAAVASWNFAFSLLT